MPYLFGYALIKVYFVHYAINYVMFLCNKVRIWIIFLNYTLLKSDFFKV